MGQNIIEFLREQAILNLFKTSAFKKVWPTWQSVIRDLTPNLTEHQILTIGDNLRKVFYSTNKKDKSNLSESDLQSEVSGGGVVWESLVCWYLNLCLIGRRTVVIKHTKDLLPDPVRFAITVNYNNFISNTESDLIAITFPDLNDYMINKEDIKVNDINGNPVIPIVRKKYRLKDVLNALTHRDFGEIEIHIIQCKTNWNDNAQIPMLWDIIYSAENFKSNTKIGEHGYSIHDVKSFTYSFVTVPTVKIENFKPNSVAVMRVANLSGGNYWGLPSKSGVASSVKELLSRNLSTGHSKNHLTTIRENKDKLLNEYNYFKIL